VASRRRGNQQAAIRAEIRTFHFPLVHHLLADLSARRNIPNGHRSTMRPGSNHASIATEDRTGRISAKPDWASLLPACRRIK
jgi:hypothetical protein